MAWNKASVMCQRRELVEKMLLPGGNISQLASEAGVSRKTAYKWLSAYKQGGLQALYDKPRIPVQQPNRSSGEIESMVIGAHKTYPYWGSYKLQQYLINTHPQAQVPSHTTIGRIIKRHGGEVIQNYRSKPATRRFERARPNELWQMDFKGSFMTRAHRCYPLTVIDDYSRFSIGINACLNERGCTVHGHLTALFSKFGLPEQINVDNGNPWGASDLNSLTSLQIWLIKCGVKLTHSAPYHPQTNGKNERFHRSLKLEVLHQRQYEHLNDIQRAFDEWRHIYNFKRPHQGIGNQTPSSRYQSSSRAFNSSVADYDYDYDENSIVRKVSETTGLFRFRGERYCAGKALGNEYIAIKETDKPEQFAVYFMDSFIKTFHIKERC